jgi:hypothetical protein
MFPSYSVTRSEEWLPFMPRNQNFGESMPPHTPTPNVTQEIFDSKLSPPPRFPTRLGVNINDPIRLETHDVCVSFALQW